MRYLSVCLFFLILAAACGENDPEITSHAPPLFIPDDPELYRTIVRQDSLFFDAYNTCAENLETYASFYAEDLEFYHDLGGLSTSKADVVEGTRENICGKVTRELVPGTIEVYPVRDYGAVEIGFHQFHNSEEPDSPANPGRFVIIWHRQEEGWKISRVVSLH